MRNNKPNSLTDKNVIQKSYNTKFIFRLAVDFKKVETKKEGNIFLLGRNKH